MKKTLKWWRCLWPDSLGHPQLDDELCSVEVVKAPPEGQTCFHITDPRMTFQGHVGGHGCIVQAKTIEEAIAAAYELHGTQRRES